MFIYHIISYSKRRRKLPNCVAFFLQRTNPNMVCLVCLVPLFLVPIVNILPLLFDFLMGKFYRLFGWEYMKPERAPPACPYKPPTTGVSKAEADVEPTPADPVIPGSVDVKQD